MGHVELASPVAHIWFLKSLPSRLSTILGTALKSLEKVIYFESYIITDSLMSPLKEGEVISEDEYEKLQEKHGYGNFIAEMGAEAVQKVLKRLDLKKLQKHLREELSVQTSDLKREKLIKRLKNKKFNYYNEHIKLDGGHIAPLEHFNLVYEFLDKHLPTK